MPEPNYLSSALVAMTQDSTIIAVVEMNQSSWLVAGMLPGNIMGDPLLRAAADIGEGADMGTEPVLVTLGPARFGVGQVRAGQAGNENLRLADDTLVDDAQRHAGVIDFERLAGAMLPAHRRRP